jgi:hypothetical protein
MNALRCSALANMQKSGLKERAQVLRRYMPGSIIVQFMRETCVHVKSVRGPASASVLAKTIVRIMEAMMPLCTLALQQSLDDREGRS